VVWFGTDPGGKKNFGIAILQDDGSYCGKVSGTTISARCIAIFSRATKRSTTPLLVRTQKRPTTGGFARGARTR
jgi:hypothetical protein